jgi:hypothetical protein
MYIECDEGFPYACTETSFMKTLHDIDVNPGLLWDYQFSPEQLQTEEFFVWYLSRVLERGTFAEVKKLPQEVTARYFERLTLSSRVRRFWEWYLKTA